MGCVGHPTADAAHEENHKGHPGSGTFRGLTWQLPGAQLLGEGSTSCTGCLASEVGSGPSCPGRVLGVYECSSLWGASPRAGTRSVLLST